MIKKIGMVKRITHVKRRLCVLVSDNVEYFFFGRVVLVLLRFKFYFSGFQSSSWISFVLCLDRLSCKER